MLSGALLWGAFPPLDLAPLGVLGPVPLLWAWRDAPPRRGAASGLLAGLAFFGLLVSWTRHVGAVAFVAFALALGAYWAGAGAVVGLYAVRGRAGPFVMAAAWVLFEGLRARWPFGGFSWGEVGYAYHDVGPLRALAAWGGVPLLSFLSVLAAGAVVARSGRVRSALVLAGVGAAVVAGNVALPEQKEEGLLRVAVVQGNDLNRELTRAERQARYLPVSHFALAEEIEGPVDLVVFPESSFDTDPRSDPFLRDGITATASRTGAAVLANAPVPVPEEGDDRSLNTNFLFAPDGSLLGTYAKQHLVPFGEYVPLRPWLNVVDAIADFPWDYAPGDERVLFDVGGVRLGTLICFESAFADVARGYARDGAQVLVVATNNRTFERSANSDQHLAIGKMRAAETGRPVVHAAISGRSALIDPRGRVLARTDLFERTVLNGEVRATRGQTPYVRWGDWVLVVSAVVLIGAARRAVRGFARSQGRP